ncbi:unnamed protein product [Brassica napus]|uniref:(rape) hypothetical protein n=1 Tax=Brassica napus TaxID=3708 RepID=A0A816I8G7_BRANA|nr:unnamed protein product [Brassica napus]
MGKILIEICLISARQLLVGSGFGSSLLKHQWFAVGWIDPKDKYCTTIDDSRSENPLWRTKFITSLHDDDDSKIHALNVEVYSREPIFLTKKLHGSATVPLKEFLAKYKNQSSSSSVVEETRSYQLRKTNSSKPQGFVDVSIRISAERQDFGGFTGDFRGVMLSNNSGYMVGSSQHSFASLNQPNNLNSFSVLPDNHNPPMPNPLTNSASSQMQQPYYPPPPMQQSYYPPPQMQQPPPMQQPYYPSAPMQPPSYPPPPMQPPYYPPPPMQPSPPQATWNAGYMPRSENAVNIPSSSSSEGAGRGDARTGPGLGAGAASYGRDYMSGAESDQNQGLIYLSQISPSQMAPFPLILHLDHTS